MDERREETRPEISLLHGYAVVEQETDANGRALRWRQLTVTFPMSAGATMSFSFDFMNQGDVSIGVDIGSVLGDEWDEKANEE